MTEAQRLREALIRVREALQLANDTPNGGIDDTLWMPHDPDTVFDYIDSVLDTTPIEDAPSQQKRYVYGPEDVLTGDFGLFL